MPSVLAPDIRLAPEAQHQLQSALEGLLRPMWDAVPLAFNAVDPQGRVVAWNAAAERLFGWTSAEVLGKPLPTVPQEARSQYREHHLGALTTQVQGQLVQRRSKDGRLLWIRLWTSRVLSHDGLLLAAVGLFSDETERRGREEQESRAASHARLLKEVAIAANESDALEPALRRALAVVCQATGWRLGHALVVEGAELRETAIWSSFGPPGHYDAFARSVETTPPQRGQGVVGAVLSTGATAWNASLEVDRSYPPWSHALAAGLRSAFAFPLQVRDEVVAVLEFYANHLERPDSELVETLIQAGQQLGRVVERLRAAREAARQEQAIKLAAAEKVEGRRRTLLEPLSRRELSVLSLLAEGSDNLKIAAMLEISERTVKTHVSALLRKLSVENRTQAALLARTAGLGRSLEG